MFIFASIYFLAKPLSSMLSLGLFLVSSGHWREKNVQKQDDVSHLGGKRQTMEENNSASRDETGHELVSGERLQTHSLWHQLQSDQIKAASS